MVQLFQYAIIFQPKQTRDAQGNDTTPAALIIQAPQFVLAKDAAQVGILAARAIPEAYLDKLEQVQIAISPF